MRNVSTSICHQKKFFEIDKCDVLMTDLFFYSPSLIPTPPPTSHLKSNIREKKNVSPVKYSEPGQG